MSRKHYIEVAAVIRTRMEQHTAADSPIDAAYRIACRDLASDLAEMFKRDNPRFDRTRFMDAAGCITV